MVVETTMEAMFRQRRSARHHRARRANMPGTWESPPRQRYAPSNANRPESWESTMARKVDKYLVGDELEGLVESDYQRDQRQDPAPPDRYRVRDEAEESNEIALRDRPALHDPFGFVDAVMPAKDEAMLMYQELVKFLKSLTSTTDRAVGRALTPLEYGPADNEVADDVLDEAKIVYSEIETSLKGLRTDITTSLQNSAAGTVAEPGLQEAFRLYSELSAFLQSYLRPAIEQASTTLQEAGSTARKEMARTVEATRGVVAKTAETAFARKNLTEAPATSYVASPFTSNTMKLLKVSEIRQQLNADPALEEARLMMADATFPGGAFTCVAELFRNVEAAIDALRKMAYLACSSIQTTQKSLLDEASADEAALNRPDEAGSVSSPTLDEDIDALDVGEPRWTFNHSDSDDSSYERGLVSKNTLDALDAAHADSSWTYNQSESEDSSHDDGAVSKATLNALDALDAAQESPWGFSENEGGAVSKATLNALDALDADESPWNLSEIIAPADEESFVSDWRSSSRSRSSAKEPEGYKLYGNYPR